MGVYAAVKVLYSFWNECGTNDRAGMLKQEFGIRNWAKSGDYVVVNVRWLWVLLKMERKIGINLVLLTDCVMVCNRFILAQLFY
ncbi:MAG: hypothetical protein CVU39_13230 [Chloroflexi bacterium HGW-Chloroflexi-10]|nr:MAG: hypothetical protein CVU39_13230 [Chloroflexi bacterium HGW-Chloroflexi-10]